MGVTRCACRDLWRFSPTPISQPLLRRLLNKEELAHQACVIYQVNIRNKQTRSTRFLFQGILRYMGDLPGRQSRVAMELTDLIFDGPLKQVQQVF